MARTEPRHSSRKLADPAGFPLIRLDLALNSGTGLFESGQPGDQTMRILAPYPREMCTFWRAAAVKPFVAYPLDLWRRL